MKLNIVCFLVATMLIAAPVGVSAQATQGERKGVPRDSVRTKTPRQVPRSTNTTDHRHTPESALAQVGFARQWMIGANQKSSVDGILNRGVNPKTSPQSFYNLKGLENKRFLQYEYQGKGQGISIGWSSNANAQTAVSRANWGFFPKNAGRRHNPSDGLRTAPIVYGEVIAIGWWVAIPRNYSEFSASSGAHVPQFLTSASRSVGPNLKWSKRGASYEWVILGGRPGTAVRRGEDRVILFNLKKKKPLLWGTRSFGAHIGFLGYSAINATVPVEYEDVDLPVWEALMLQPARDAMRR